jgi:hypothetical protein
LLGCAAIALCGAVQAQDFSSPEAADSYFAGFYAGIIGGFAGGHDNFFPSGGLGRGQAGAVAGWNVDVAPQVIVGGELLALAQSDFNGTYSAAFAALGHVGGLVEDNLAFYLVGGAGYMGSAPALIYGIRSELGVYDSMSVRAELLNLIEVGPGARPGLSGQMYNVGVLWHLGEGGSNETGWLLNFDRATDFPDFDGLYGGVSFGLHHNTALNFFPNVGFGGHPTRADLGGFAGWNLRLGDSWIVAGVEGQAGVLTDTSGDVSYNAWGLGRLGMTPFEGLLAYGQAGVGLVQDKAAFGYGGGIEYAAFDHASVRFEGLAYGEIATGTISAGKGSAGIVWHIN